MGTRSVRPDRGGLLDRGTVHLARVLYGDQHPAVLNQRAAGLGAASGPSGTAGPHRAAPGRGNTEQAVVRAELVAVRGQPQVAVRVEGDVVRAGDRADLVLGEAAEVGARVLGVAADQEEAPGEASCGGVVAVLGELQDLPVLVDVARVGLVGAGLPVLPRSVLLVSATYTRPVRGLASTSSGRSILVAPTLSAASRVKT